jgi:hypothetical protein
MGNDEFPPQICTDSADMVHHGGTETLRTMGI